MALPSDLAALQGVWWICALEADGRRIDVPPGSRHRVSIEGDEWVAGMPGNGPVRRTRVAVDAARHRFDVLIGPGVTSPGIYALDGDRLTVCLNQRALRRAIGHPIPGDETSPPNSLSAPAGSGYRLWVMERTD